MDSSAFNHWPMGGLLWVFVGVFFAGAFVGALITLTAVILRAEGVI